MIFILVQGYEGYDVSNRKLNEYLKAVKLKIKNFIFFELKNNLLNTKFLNHYF